MFILSSEAIQDMEKIEKNEEMNFQTTYLKFIFGIMGVQDTTIISLDNNEEFGGGNI
jgi:FMN-dependent NADH-azoreductase